MLTRERLIAELRDLLAASHERGDYRPARELTRLRDELAVLLANADAVPDPAEARHYPLLSGY